MKLGQSPFFEWRIMGSDLFIFYIRKLPSLNDNLSAAFYLWLCFGSWLTPMRHRRVLLCYRTKLVREEGVGDFLGKINKLSG